MGLVVAIYAAVVSTGTLIWKMVSWRRDRQPKLHIEVRLSPIDPEASIKVLPNIMVVAYNSGDSGLGIREMGFFSRTRCRQARHIKPANMWGTDLPAFVEAQKGVWMATTRSRAETAGIDTTKRLTGYALLMSGKEVRSKPTILPWGTPPKEKDDLDFRVAFYPFD